MVSLRSSCYPAAAMPRRPVIKWLVFTGCVIKAFTVHAQASIVTRCTGPEGYSYFSEGPLVRGKDVGWQKDAITQGSYLVTKAGDNYDIIYVDAANRTVSTREDGGEVIAIVEKPGVLVLLTAYASGLVETWTFRLNDRGAGSLMHAMSRSSGIPTEKYSLMRATCSK
jgi:hypothetical protein